MFIVLYSHWSHCSLTVCECDTSVTKVSTCNRVVMTTDTLVQSQCQHAKTHHYWLYLVLWLPDIQPRPRRCWLTDAGESELGVISWGYSRTLLHCICKVNVAGHWSTPIAKCIQQVWLSKVNMTYHRTFSGQLVMYIKWNSLVLVLTTEMLVLWQAQFAMCSLKMFFKKQLWASKHLINYKLQCAVFFV